MLYTSFWKPHKSESEAHLSIADLVCAASQQHFRGQETALRAEGDSDKQGSFQGDGRQNHNILAPGNGAIDTWPVPQVFLCWGSATGHTVLGQAQTLLGQHRPSPHGHSTCCRCGCPALL